MNTLSVAVSSVGACTCLRLCSYIMLYYTYIVHTYYVRISVESTSVSTTKSVGRVTALHVGSSRVLFPVRSLGFYFDLILPAAVWIWGRLSLYQKWGPHVSLRGKGGLCVGQKNLPPSCANFLEILGTSASWTSKGLCRSAQGLLYPLVT